MPIRTYDPFIDPTTDLNPSVNPFMDRMKRGAETGTLPLLFGPQLQGKAGNWKDTFKERAKMHGKADPSAGLILEVGCHKGETIRDMALDHPELAFLGIDITFKRVVNTAEKAVASQAANILSILCNGRGLHKILAPEELDGAIIFFPDPWANKKRQRKNRLLSADFLMHLKSRIRPGGFVWIKTDDWGYASDIEQHATQAGFTRCEKRDSLPIPLPSSEYISRFERHFREQGLETFDGCWVH